MKTTLIWLPRIAGVAMAGFLAVFALDSANVMDALVHLIPSVAVLLVVWAAWRRPLIGAVAFAVCALAYGLATRRLDWFLAIGGPLLLASVLHLVGWRAARATQ